MKIDVSDDTIDNIVAAVIFEAITGTDQMCKKLLNSEYELESYELQDLRTGLKDLKVLKAAFKYFSPISEHYKVDELNLC
jgi:hypothetical protein